MTCALCWTLKDLVTRIQTMLLSAYGGCHIYPAFIHTALYTACGKSLMSGFLVVPEREHKKSLHVYLKSHMRSIDFRFHIQRKGLTLSVILRIIWYVPEIHNFMFFLPTVVFHPTVLQRRKLSCMAWSLLLSKCTYPNHVCSEGSSLWDSLPEIYVQVHKPCSWYSALFIVCNWGMLSECNWGMQRVGLEMLDCKNILVKKQRSIFPATSELQ